MVFWQRRERGKKSVIIIHHHHPSSSSCMIISFHLILAFFDTFSHFEFLYFVFVFVFSCFNLKQNKLKHTRTTKYHHQEFLGGGIYGPIDGKGRQGEGSIYRRRPFFLLNIPSFSGVYRQQSTPPPPPATLI